MSIFSFEALISNFLIEFFKLSAFKVLKKGFNIKGVRVRPNFNKNYILVSLGLVFFFSTPVFSSIRRFYLNKRAIKYASYVFEKIIRDQKQPDLILIDGRYRVLCCLFVYKFLLKNKNDKISIIVDDFLNRRYYQILYKLFDIEIIGRIAHLRFKKTDADIDKLIEKYQYDPR